MTTNSQLPVQTAVPRHYGLDWLRIAAFGLLMLYHVGMVFVTGSWLVKTAQPIEALAYPMLFLTPWRLAVLFIVSGYASRALLVRLPGIADFVRERSARLLIPLIAAMVLVIPPQSWIGQRFNHGYTHDFAYFLTHDWLRFGQLDGMTLPGWEHLWFVFYLWFFTMILAALLLAFPGLTTRAGRWIESLGTGSRLLWLPLMYLVPVRVAITFTTGETHGLFNDWLSDAIYLPLFLFGFLFAGTQALWPAIARLWKPALALALASYAVLAIIETLYPEPNTPPHLEMALNRAAIAGMMWGMSITLLQLANTLLNRDHRWRQPLSAAVFPFYIIHQTAIVVIGWWLLPMGLGVAVDATIILAGTALSCLAFWQLGRQVGWVGTLIGLPRRKPAPSPVQSVAPASL